jgi:hypothetical protein
MEKIRDYKGLTNFLLEVVRIRPAMYLGEAKLSLLPTFIIGYNIGYHMANSSDQDIDEYFDGNGFLEWFYKKRNIRNTGSWTTPFLEEAKGDESKALMLFFKHLEEYRTDRYCIKSP